MSEAGDETPADAPHEEEGGGVHEEAAPEESASAKTKQAFCLCGVGCLLLPGMLVMLGLNERNFVCTKKNIIYAETSAVETACSGVPPEDEFVFFSCALDQSVFRTFTFADFNPNVGGGNRLGQELGFESVSASQYVEMYQCVEKLTESFEGSGENRKKVTQISYRMAWKSTWENSNRWEGGPSQFDCPGFDGRNPGFPRNVQQQGGVQRASVVRAGAFTLHSSLTNQIDPDSDVSLAEFVDRFPTSLPGFTNNWDPMPDLDERTVRPIQDGRWYLRSCDVPELGCVRISYRQSGARHVSVLANSGSGGQTKSQPTKASWGCSAGTYEALYQRQMGKADTTESEHSKNAATAWLLRILGILGAWLAVYCCLNPIVVFFDVLGDLLGKVPCVGFLMEMLMDVAETLVKVVVCCMSCSFGVSAALFTIALVWVIMRPLVGGLLLAAAAILGIGALLFMKFAPRRGGPSREPKIAPEPMDAAEEEAAEEV